ncbi:putative 2-succinyl-6-hydroxy-2,4-cyclohexadiene-1-carboxylate synthase [Vibrio comitans NBRC 102076]|uniref:Putative 2-succinyl-6-hydroxy-2,4-cyclohexadiene-1-carboxylate synthase n=1 Tax=Vibrio comitans NBRC 102076 TaxID=1219078 RepID=A0A4Y3IT42_9VIBR|nr:putative 2-succinyl-6-hydroxy-2,4-cyclohexadiene-1-carboxylate synthase [Vibrio comitans NBRC 102076]
MPLSVSTSSPLLPLRALTSAPTARLVFVHGFLGSRADWKSVVQYLPDSVDAYALDLPGHGSVKQLRPKNFKGFVEHIKAQLQYLPDDGTPLFLVGYSLGARLLMHLAVQLDDDERSIAGFVIEGGNFGLQQESEIESRWENDYRWIARFREHPLTEVLNDWYQQSIFTSLTSVQRKRLIEERTRNDGEALAEVMSVTSLAKQDYLLPLLLSTQHKIYYIAGENDEKFCRLYESSKVDYEVVSGAGHNAHKDQPNKYAKKLTQLLSLRDTDSL